MEEPFLYNWYSNDSHIRKGQDGRTAFQPFWQTDDERQDGRTDVRSWNEIYNVKKGGRSMAINGISSYGLNSIYGYQSSINSLRLSQALSRNPKLNQSYSSSSTSSLTSRKAAMNADISFVKDYSSKMSDLMNAANELKSSNKYGAMSDLSITSTNNDIATASGKLLVKNDKEYKLDVTQVAQAQVNASEGVKASDYAKSAMNFTVGDGKNSVNVSVGTVKANGGSKTNAQMLKEAADQINKSKVGVTASVVEKDGVASLQLEGKETGEGKTFTVSGEQLGAAAGVENVKTESANAKYSVTADGRTTEYETDTNKVSIGYYGVSVELKKAGETTLKAGVDSGNVASALGDLVDAYNSAVKFLNDNYDRGSGVSRQLRNMISGIGSEQSLKQLGITVNKDATLSFSESKFQANMQKNPNLSKELISGMGGIADRMFNKANSAMNVSSSSLLNGSSQKSFSGTSASSSSSSLESMATNPYSVMGMFSKGGAYNMSNYYAVGMMMNYLI